MQEASRLIPTIIKRFRKAFPIRLVSLIPRPRPTPTIGPIRGDISIAPIITAVELMLRPTDAIMMENARIQTFGPRK